MSSAILSISFKVISILVENFSKAWFELSFSEFSLKNIALGRKNDSWSFWHIVHPFSLIYSSILEKTKSSTNSFVFYPISFKQISIIKKLKSFNFFCLTKCWGIPQFVKMIHNCLHKYNDVWRGFDHFKSNWLWKYQSVNEILKMRYNLFLWTEEEISLNFSIFLFIILDKSFYTYV